MVHFYKSSNRHERKRADGKRATGGRTWVNPWWEQASCQGLDTNMFFRDDEWSKGSFPEAAARMCFTCPVMVTCRLAGYGEYYGDYGNQPPHERDKIRWSIFGRLFKNEMNRDDDLRGLRSQINKIIEMGTDVLASMRKVGFNEEEIALLMHTTTNDKRAMKTLEKHEKFTTRDQNYRKAKSGYVFKNT